MEVHFQIDYRTIWGEEVRVRILQKDGTESILPLPTTDGKTWRGTLNVSGNMTYQYFIFKEGKETLSECGLNKRRIEDNNSGYAIYAFDSWRQEPNMKYLFSSAFTECIRHEEKEERKAKDTLHSKTLRINVSAPQLEEGQQLYMNGNQKMLGNWDIKKSVELKKSEDILGWYIQLDASKLTFPLEYKFYSAKNNEKDTIDWECGMNHRIDELEIRDKEIYILSDLTINFARPLWKGAGVAIPIFSLKSKESFGIGDFGDLQKMIDWASLTHQRIVQILPINDTTMTHTWTDSYPYSSISIFALHPMYMNLKALGRIDDKEKAEYYKEKQKELNALPKIDYEAVNKTKWDYIKDIFAQEGKKVLASAEFKKFMAANEEWLMPYAAFCYLRDKFGTPDFHLWGDYQLYNPKKVADLCSPKSEAYKTITLYYFVQFELHCQLLESSKYARSKHIILKGDIPIGISRNSVEAWAEPHYFNLNGQAGAPPDDFSVKGQNWGFPTYNWDEMAKDNYKWWRRRFRQMSQYFDAYRIDHILGFFRIWEIPMNAVHGLLGQFSPSLPLSVDEIQRYGIWFRKDYFTRPYINDFVIEKIFGEYSEEVKAKYLKPIQDGLYEMLPKYDTQRKIEAEFLGKADDKSNWLREGLYALISDVLFVPDRKNPNMYHPRIAVQFDFIYNALSWEEKDAFNRLYNDYYYRRHNDFWYHEAMKKLPCLIGSTRMLVCGEDLGMVPDCVGAVMNQLQILSLELQRMPKSPKNEFGHINEYPYLSVCTFSSHDTSTIRGWWEEDRDKTARFYYDELHQQGELPASAPGWVCKQIVNQQLNSSSMLSILTFQDWLSIDEHLRLPDAQAERINVPANPKHYWRYRIHLTLEELMKCDELNEEIRQMIDNSGRNMK